MENTINPSIVDALNVERGDYVFEIVINLFNEKDCSSDVIKSLMCSELDTKECFLACYFLGRIKERYEMEKQAKIDEMIAQFIQSMQPK